MAVEWYYQASGRVLGPVSASELMTKSRSGEIGRDTFVRKGRKGYWLTAKQFMSSVSGRGVPGSTSSSSRRSRAARHSQQTLDHASPEDHEAEAIRWAQNARGGQQNVHAKPGRRIIALTVSATVAVVFLIAAVAYVVIDAQKRNSRSHRDDIAAAGAITSPLPIATAHAIEQAKASFGEFVKITVDRVRTEFGSRKLYKVPSTSEADTNAINVDEETMLAMFAKEYRYDLAKRDPTVSHNKPVAGFIILTYRTKQSRGRGGAGVNSHVSEKMTLRVECSYRERAWHVDTDIANELGVHAPSI